MQSKKKEKVTILGTYTNIKEFIEANYKPGYVWLNKRNFQIIKIETLEKSLKEWEKAESEG